MLNTYDLHEQNVALLEAIAKRQITITYLAKSSGVSRSTINRFINYECDTTFSNFGKISNTLNLTDHEMSQIFKLHLKFYFSKKALKDLPELLEANQ